mmetsp:Transcript_34699/g.101985  ORF Transcript_34699/g.101985 Transcript_34699/m.101985 type:complete len:243 (-) Transcript_34699:64-792(-)
MRPSKINQLSTVTSHKSTQRVMKRTHLVPLLHFLLYSANAEYLRNIASDSSSSDEITRVLQVDNTKEGMVARCRGSRCDIPHVGYVRVLHAGEWLTPNQYLAEFDANGTPVFTFGLTADGTFGLYDEDGLMIWGPKDEHDDEPVRCDKLKFQSSNGHLTCYNSHNNEDGSYRIEHVWKSKCKDDGYPFPRTGKVVRKITLADGDVNQIDTNGAVVWTLRGSQIHTDPDADIEPICRPKLVSK